MIIQNSFAEVLFFFGLMIFAALFVGWVYERFIAPRMQTFEDWLNDDARRLQAQAHKALKRRPRLSASWFRHL